MVVRRVLDVLQPIRLRQLPSLPPVDPLAACSLLGVSDPTVLSSVSIQAGTGLSTRTHHWKDTAAAGHSRIDSRTKSTDTNLTNAPDGTAHTLTVRECRLTWTTVPMPWSSTQKHPPGADYLNGINPHRVSGRAS